MAATYHPLKKTVFWDVNSCRLIHINNILQNSTAGLPCLWASVLWFCLFTVIIVQYYTICGCAALNSYLHLDCILHNLQNYLLPSCFHYVWMGWSMFSWRDWRQKENKSNTSVIKVKVPDKLGEGNKNCCHCAPLWQKQSKHVFHRKNGDKIKTILKASVQSTGNISCVRHQKLIFERKKRVSCVRLEDGAQKMLSVNGCCGDGVGHTVTQLLCTVWGWRDCQLPCH